MEKSHDIYESIYWKIKQGQTQLTPVLRTAIIRLRKFLALPYCYFRFVDWEECTASRFQVILDFLYIFFVLKTYPEHYGYCRLWEKERDTWKYYYGSNYDAYQSYRLGREVQKKEYHILFKDKEVCHQLCTGSGLRMPKIHGILDPRDDYISKLRKMINNHNQLIIKPVIGHGGHGVQLVRNCNGTIRLGAENDSHNLDDLDISERHIVQEYIEQDERLSILTPSASIRIITLYTRTGEVIVLFSKINTAVGNNIASNWSAGGIAIGIDTKTGRLNETGFDKKGHQHLTHPTTNIKFSDYIIPDWDKIIEYAVNIQKSFPYFKILGPDITLSTGGPMLFEINATPDLSSPEQVNGPLLENKRVLHEFKEYDLLINNAFNN